MQGALAAGYAHRLQERTLAEQDEIRSAASAALGEAELAARASEARFRAVFAGAAIGIGLGDAQGNILDANPALRKMLGYSVRQMRTRNVGDFMHPEDVQKVWVLYEQLIRGERESFPNGQAVSAQRRQRHLDTPDRFADQGCGRQSRVSDRGDRGRH